MGDRSESNLHLCPDVIVNGGRSNWKMRSNKVGVENSGGGGGGFGGGGGGGGFTDVETGVADDEDRGGSGSNLSAKVRASSGLSQFQEVDFSEQVCPSNSEPQRRMRNSVRDIKEGIKEETSSIGEWRPRDNWQRLKEEFKRKVRGRKDSQDYDEEMVSIGELSQIPANVATEDETEPTGLANPKVTENGVKSIKEDQENHKKLVGESGDKERLKANGGTEKLGKIEANGTSGGRGKGGIFVIDNERASGSGTRRSRPTGQNCVPHGRQNHCDTQRMCRNVGSSYGKGSKPWEPTPSTSTTVDTDLSFNSIREDNDEEEEEEKPKRPLRPPMDDRQKPTLTKTSLAIYSNLEQEPSQRNRNLFLLGMAVLTFVITFILSVAILVAPKTLAVKEDKHQRPTSTTKTHNASKNGSSEMHAESFRARGKSLLADPVLLNRLTINITTTTSVSLKDTQGLGLKLATTIQSTLKEPSLFSALATTRVPTLATPPKHAFASAPMVLLSSSTVPSLFTRTPVSSLAYKSTPASILITPTLGEIPTPSTTLYKPSKITSAVTIQSTSSAVTMASTSSSIPVLQPVSATIATSQIYKSMLRISTSIPTLTPTPTYTPPTWEFTPTPSLTYTYKHTRTSMHAHTHTQTVTPTHTYIVTPSHTHTSTYTSTYALSNTPIFWPTYTEAPKYTHSTTPKYTPTLAYTSTHIHTTPTLTHIHSSTPVLTQTPTHTHSILPTPKPTHTPTETHSILSTPRPTHIPTHTHSILSTPNPTHISTSSTTQTPISILTPTPTYYSILPTLTPHISILSTLTSSTYTPTPSKSPTLAPTPDPMPTGSPTVIHTPTPIPKPSAVPLYTSTHTSTSPSSPIPHSTSTYSSTTHQ